MSTSGSAARTSLSSPVDTMRACRRAERRHKVTHAAEFTFKGFKGPARFIAPLLGPALDRLGQHAPGRPPAVPGAGFSAPI